MNNTNYPNINSYNNYYETKQEYRRYLKRKRIIRHNIKVIITLVFLTALFMFIAGKALRVFLDKIPDNKGSAQAMSYNAGFWEIGNDQSKDYIYYEENNYDNVDKSEIPEQLIDFMERRPETTDFVMSYPEKHDTTYYIDLSKEVTAGEIPLFIQWDERWGYKQYGDDFFALNGCGPTCLSMVCLGLGGDTKYDPYTVGQLMDNNGYYETGVGSKWSVMTDGASLIGLHGEEISLDEYVIRSTLENGSPIICSVGEGDFTQSGHFIVLAGIASDGNIIVNDPCSRINSEQTWELSRLMPQIKNLWAFSLN